MRWQIKTGLRRVWRGAGILQIGLTGRRGTVLTGLTQDDVPLLEQLRDGIEADDVRTGEGLAGARRRELVDLLTGAGVLVGIPAGRPVRDGLGAGAERLAPDAEVWSVVHPEAGDGWELMAARASKQVTISGAGRLGSVLAAGLAAAGVGELVVDDPRRVTAADLVPGGAAVPDLGRRREEATIDAVRRQGSRARTSSAVPGRPRTGRRQSGSGAATRTAREHPDLVVLVEHGVADATAAGRLVSNDVPHLSVVVREDDVLVGPLVRPGSGPCLRCLDLHRGDRDPAWPGVLAQLLHPAAGPSEAEETGTAVLAAGLATLQVLAHLDGVAEPAAAAATLEVELPDGLIARRSWPAHPACGCHRLPHEPDPPSGMGRADAHDAPTARRMNP